MSDPETTPEVDYSQVDVLRAMAVYQGASGLPEDRFVSTFHFARNPGVTVDVDAGLVAGWLQAFYEDVAPGATKALSAWLSDTAIAPGASAGEIRVYDLDDFEPRLAYIFPLAKVTAGTLATLPNETAVALSVYGERNIPRQRGRIFFGPLTSAAGAPSATDHDLRVAATLQADLVDAAQKLIADSANRWVVLSRGLYKDGQQPASITPIENGWVDNAFDTIRKRGVKASARVTFP